MQVNERRNHGITLQLLAVVIGLLISASSVLWSAATIKTELTDFRGTQVMSNANVAAAIARLEASSADVSVRLTRLETIQSGGVK